MNHVQVARVLGLSPATVSRLRGGVRPPTIENMQIIGDRMGWQATLQMEALQTADWPSAFEAAITEYDIAQRDDEPGEQDQA
jgi:transcriptional regulator with XRE-family HTH domain